MLILNQRAKAVQIWNLPMPDGTYKTYRAPRGKSAIKKILALWQAEKAAMIRAISWH